MRIVKLWIIIILLLLVAILVAQNSEVVTVRLFFWQVNVSRVVLLVLTFAAGALTGFAVAKLPRKGARRG